MHMYAGYTHTHTRHEERVRVYKFIYARAEQCVRTLQFARARLSLSIRHTLIALGFPLLRACRYVCMSRERSRVCVRKCDVPTRIHYMRTFQIELALNAALWKKDELLPCVYRDTLACISNTRHDFALEFIVSWNANKLKCPVCAWRCQYLTVICLTDFFAFDVKFSGDV